MTESTDKLAARAAGLETLMGEKLSLFGGRGTLAARARRAGRLLPRAARRDAEAITEAQALAAHPKLRRRLDAKELKRAEGRLRQTLGTIDPGDRRKGYWLGVLTGLVFNMIVLGGLILAVLLWRGLI